MSGAAPPLTGAQHTAATRQRQREARLALRHLPQAFAVPVAAALESESDLQAKDEIILELQAALRATLAELAQVESERGKVEAELAAAKEAARRVDEAAEEIHLGLVVKVRALEATVLAVEGQAAAKRARFQDLASRGHVMHRAAEVATSAAGPQPVPLVDDGADVRKQIAMMVSNNAVHRERAAEKRQRELAQAGRPPGLLRS